MASDRESESSSVQFTLFASLPPELRFKIWNESFLPRVVELHSQKFSVHQGLEWEWVDRFGVRPVGKPQWVSNNSNPAALSICSESRGLAQNRYSVLLPVFRARPSEPIPRTLYFDPSSDLLAILGEGSFKRIIDLLQIIREQDVSERGVRRFGLSMRCWTYHSRRVGPNFWDSLDTKGLFSQLEEIVFLMYDEKRPPASFRDGECAVEKVGGMEAFSRFLSMNIRSLYDSGPVRIMDLRFIPGPVSRRAIESSGMIV
ncbi:hypothetical protein F5Y05DRAFT_384536 [Hypoxylon sp. FL0543]|nr:hypothetical protein F5Y05DRAFT_384536 [Hypoxylon sp. FL0543]